MKALTLIAALALTGCDAILDDPDALHTFTCSVVPYYAGDCTSAEVQTKVASVLADGAVEAQIECSGIAIGPGGKFVSVQYNAAKLQDGACFATSNLTGPSAAGVGFTQSGASRLTRRSDALADACPVTSFHVPQLRSDTTVSGGVVRIESPFCAPGACTMLVSTNCSGLRLDRF